MKILILSSSSRHFPLDIQTVLKGYECHRLDSLNGFISSPLRNEPFLGVLEVGSTEDVDRALIAYEWAETVQPLAAARFLLLLGSKHISLQEKAGRFRGVEIAQLPLPPKNLLFKVELQLRVLANAKKPAEKTGFRAEFEGGAEKERVLVVKGPGPKEGSWNASGEAPQGKVRWRWIDNLLKTESDFDWSVESRQAPEFDAASESWKVKEPDADLRCHRSGEEVFSAKRAAAGPASRPALQEEASGSGLEPTKVSVSQEPASSAAPPQSAGPASPSASLAGVFAGTKAEEEAKSEKKQALAENHQSPRPLSPNPSLSPPASAAEKSSSSPSATPSENSRGPGLEFPKPSSASEPAPERAAAPSSPPAAFPPKPEESGAAASPSAPGSPPAASAPREQPPSASATQIAGANPASVPRREFNTSQTPPASSGRSPPLPAPAPPPSPFSTSQISPKAESAEEKKTPPAPASRAPEEKKSAPREASPRPLEAEKKAPAPLPPPAEPEPRIPERAPPVPASAASRPVPPSSHSRAAATPPQPLGEKANLPGPKEKQPSPSPSVSASRNESAQGQSPEITAKEGREGSAPEKINAAASERKENTGEIVISRNESYSAHQNLVRASDRDNKTETRVRSRGEPETQAPPSLKMRLFHTMTLEELEDKNSSWHPVEGYRIYLAAEHRYHRMKNADDLLPLWVYEGELAPEFLDLQKAWKFYDRLPEAYGSLEALPPPVARFLQEIASAKPEAPAGSGAAADEAAKESQGAQGKASPIAPAREPKGEPAARAPAKNPTFSPAWFLELMNRLLGR